MELKNLSKVNYLIGPNGSGKSSILELIQMVFNATYVNLDDAKLDEAFGDPKAVFKPDFELQYSYLAENGTEEVVRFGLDQKEFESGKAVLKECNGKHLRDIGHSVNASNSWRTLPNIESWVMDPEKLLDLVKNDDLIDFINKWEFRSKKVLRIIPSTTTNNCHQLELEDKTTINLKSLSSGQLALITFYFKLLSAVEGVDSFKKSENKDPEYFQIFCIDEPENTLHPELQKQIPLLLNDFIQSKSFVFFVATHSPFIISKSGQFPVTQKVYSIENGVAVDIDQKIKGGCFGYADSTVNAVASKMVGVDVTDIGYVENFCILEERSLQELLIALQKDDRKIIKNWGFISTGGNGNVGKFVKRINEFETFETLIKCNPFYYDKYCVVVDAVSEEEKASKEFEKMKSKLGEKRFVLLSKTKIEGYYPADIKKDFYGQKTLIPKNVKYPDKGGEGDLKVKFAKDVTERILKSGNPRAKFSEIFEGELDFLLA